MAVQDQVSNNALLNSAFQALRLGSIKPMGWLRNQLEIQKNGLTGHLDAHWEDVGPNSGWLGGSGEGWERGPYYVDGLLPLAYLLEDQTLIEKANKWIEWTLASQKEDGSFGPVLKTVNHEVAQQDWWQYFIMLKVLTQYQEVTQDERVIPFMTRYFHYMNNAVKDLPLKEWAQARGADLLLSIHWLYERTQDSVLLELAETIQAQMIDWGTIFRKFPYQRKQNEWDHRIHVVNVAMAVKAPAVIYRQTGRDEEREAVYQGITDLMRYHGQAHGMFSGDEWLSGTHPSQGVELCAVVEYMFSMENLVRILGDGLFGDILEKVGFNALPAAISPEWDSHQYDQQVNQVMCNAAKRPWVNSSDANRFGLEPNFGCCTANMHQGWPKLAASLWMGTHDGGIAAVSYAPCLLQTSVADDTDLSLTVQTEYPFREQIRMDVALSKAAAFPILLRIPGWCKRPEVRVNKQLQQLQVVNGFARIDRLWQDGDCIEMILPMDVELDERNNHAVNVQSGPLVYVLPLGEQWIRVRERERFHDWEVYPTSAWQYALVRDAAFERTEQAVSHQPYQTASAPVKLVTEGKILANWLMEQHSAGDPPLNPRPYPGEATRLELVPYGCARLRIGEFPVL